MSFDFHNTEHPNEWLEAIEAHTNFMNLYTHLCETPTMRSPGGVHRLYILDDYDSIRGIGQHHSYGGVDCIDLHGGGTSLYLPPSTRPDGGNYGWILSPHQVPFKKLKSIGELPFIKFKSIDKTTDKGGNGKDKKHESEKTIFVHDKQAYRMAAYNRIFLNLETAKEGNRNNALVRAAYQCAVLADPGQEEQLIKRLSDTALSRGLPERESRATIASGWAAGFNNKKEIIEEGKPEPKQPKHYKTDRFIGGTIEEILAYKFPKPQWVVPNIIPQGLSVIAGNPKMGKSLLALQITGDFSAGKPIFGEIAIEKSRSLYLALEDTPGRIQYRLKKQGIEANKLGNVFTDWERGYAGIEQLHQFMRDFPDTRLIVIDTLHKFYPMQDTNDYTETDRVMSAIKHFADEYQIAVILIHHTKKCNTSNDIFHSPLGSVGIIGAADTIIILNRKRGTDAGTLHLTGRDVQEMEKAIKFDSNICRWGVIGNAFEVQVSESRQEIINLIEDVGPMNPRAIADALGKNRETIRNLCWKMANDGKIIKVGRGLYSINKPTRDIYDGVITID